MIYIINKNYVAIDLGSSSGRILNGCYKDGKIDIQEIHRFEMKSFIQSKISYWDYKYIFKEIKIGLKKIKEKGLDITTIGVDSWGVDYALLAASGNIIGAPIQYRTDRTKDVFNIADELKKEIYFKTGIANFSYNTLFQLLSDKKIRNKDLKSSSTILFIADLINYLLTGKKRNEYSIASTSGLINLETRKWDYTIIEKLGLPKKLFTELIDSGTVIGTLNKQIQEELGLTEEIKVIAVGSHDTASAVAAIPYDQDGAYLISGSWSLLGVELDSPIINDFTRDNEFSNEGGVFGKIRFLKNINGLFLLQQLKKEYSQKFGEIKFTDIIREARNVKNKNFKINPNDEIFFKVDSIMQAIQEYCIKNNFTKPNNLGEYAIAIYNGLIEEYKLTLNQLEKATGKNYDTVYMVGGGIQDEFLCEKVKENLRINILAGPIEASSLGNILMQMYANGDISSLNEGRKLIKKSIMIKKY